MRSSLFNIVTKPIFILIICGAFSILQATAFDGIVSYSFSISMLTGFFEALVIAGLVFLLWKAIRFGNYAALELYQRIINYSALGILFIAIWIIISSLFFYLIFGDMYLDDLYKIIRLKALLGIFLYIIITQLLHARLTKEEVEMVVENEISEVNEDETSKNYSTEIIERIAVKTGQKIHVIMVTDIIYIQSDGDYVQIFTENAKYLKEETMKYFEMHLPNNAFVRVHRSYIVNVEKILRIELYEKNNQILTLSNGDKIKASSTGYKELRSVLGL